MADVKARGYTDVLAPSWEVAHNLAVANGKLSGAASFTLPKKWTYEVEIDSECIIEVAAKDDFDPVNGT